MEANIKIHPFEASGLGKAPFKCVAVIEKVYQACPGAPIQPGGCCDYCGTGIRYCAVIKSSDGKTFEVGTDCMDKTYRASAKTDFEREFARNAATIRSEMTKIKHAQVDKRIAKAMEIFEAHRDEFHKMWRNAPPAKYADSIADYIDWMMGNAGRSGKTAVARLIEGIAKRNGWK